MSKTRNERAKALEEWADRVDPTDLRDAGAEALRKIAEIAERRAELDRRRPLISWPRRSLVW